MSLKLNLSKFNVNTKSSIAYIVLIPIILLIPLTNKFSIYQGQFRKWKFIQMLT
jgi:hypothetical protein